MQWTILYATILGIPVLIVAHNNVAAVYFVTAGLVFAICSSILLFMFVPKVLASRIKKDTNTPVNRWQKPVEGKPAGESHEIEGVLDSDNREQYNTNLHGVDELEQTHEPLANHGEHIPD